MESAKTTIDSFYKQKIETNFIDPFDTAPLKKFTDHFKGDYPDCHLDSKNKNFLRCEAKGRDEYLGLWASPDTHSHITAHHVSAGIFHDNDPSSRSHSGELQQAHKKDGHWSSIALRCQKFSDDGDLLCRGSHYHNHSYEVEKREKKTPKEALQTLDVYFSRENSELSLMDDFLAGKRPAKKNAGVLGHLWSWSPSLVNIACLFGTGWELSRLINKPLKVHRSDFETNVDFLFSGIQKKNKTIGVFEQDDWASVLPEDESITDMTRVKKMDLSFLNTGDAPSDIGSFLLDEPQLSKVVEELKKENIDVFALKIEAKQDQCPSLILIGQDGSSEIWTADPSRFKTADQENRKVHKMFSVKEISKSVKRIGAYLISAIAYTIFAKSVNKMILPAPLPCYDHENKAYTTCYLQEVQWDNIYQQQN